MSTYNFDKTVQIGDYETRLCTAEAYGCFEDVVDGGEGGLWFDRNEDGTLSLCDYDGYYDLPKEVRQALTDFGCDITWVTQYDE